MDSIKLTDWTLLLGKYVQQLRIGPYDVILALDDDMCLSIYGDYDGSASFKLYSSAGVIKTGNSEGSYSMAAAGAMLYTLVGQTILDAGFQEPDSLVVRFSNAERLVVYKNGEQYESFTVTWPHGFVVI